MKFNEILGNLYQIEKISVAEQKNIKNLYLIDEQDQRHRSEMKEKNCDHREWKRGSNDGSHPESTHHKPGSFCAAPFTGLTLVQLALSAKQSPPSNSSRGSRFAWWEGTQHHRQ